MDLHRRRSRLHRAGRGLAQGDECRRQRWNLHHYLAPRPLVEGRKWQLSQCRKRLRQGRRDGVGAGQPAQLHGRGHFGWNPAEHPALLSRRRLPPRRRTRPARGRHQQPRLQDLDARHAQDSGQGRDMDGGLPCVRDVPPPIRSRKHPPCDAHEQLLHGHLRDDAGAVGPDPDGPPVAIVFQRHRLAGVPPRGAGLLQRNPDGGEQHGRQRQRRGVAGPPLRRLVPRPPLRQDGHRLRPADRGAVGVRRPSRTRLPLLGRRNRHQELAQRLEPQPTGAVCAQRRLG